MRDFELCSFVFLLVFLFLARHSGNGFFILFLFFRVVSVLQHRLDVPTDQSHEQGSTETSRNEVEKRGLGVLVPVHDEDGESKPGNVRDERRVEVEVRVSIERSIVTEQQSDEDSRNDDVAESKHRHVFSVETVLEQVLRKD